MLFDFPRGVRGCACAAKVSFFSLQTTIFHRNSSAARKLFRPVNFMYTVSQNTRRDPPPGGFLAEKVTGERGTTLFRAKPRFLLRSFLLDFLPLRGFFIVNVSRVPCVSSPNVNTLNLSSFLGVTFVQRDIYLVRGELRDDIRSLRFNRQRRVIRAILVVEFFNPVFFPAREGNANKTRYVYSLQVP